MKDIYILSDVMEYYRTVFKMKYGIELFGYYTMNYLPWQLFMKNNKYQIKLMSNYNTYEAFQNMSRGWICVCF